MPGVINFYPRYSELGASSRHRFYGYFQRLAAEGEAVEMHPGMSDGYLQKLYAGKGVSKCLKLREFMHLFLRGTEVQDRAIIEYELVPGLPWRLEHLLLKNRRYILNFDDNVWVKYQNISLLRNKFDMLCRNASGIIAANKFLLDKVSSLNKNVCLIPTVVDLEKYRDDVEKSGVFTAVWIGTPVTYKYLEDFLPVLQRVFNTPDCRLLVVARKDLGSTRPLKGVNAWYVDWSETAEVSLLKQSHIGLMPLTDDDFSRGKSAFKLLQYQAAGLPLVASPVGENNLIVEQGKNGFCAKSVDGWINAVDLLKNDRALYAACSEYALSKAYEYSFQKYYPLFKEFIYKTFDI